MDSQLQSLLASKDKEIESYKSKDKEYEALKQENDLLKKLVAENETLKQRPSTQEEYAHSTSTQEEYAHSESQAEVVVKELAAEKNIENKVFFPPIIYFFSLLCIYFIPYCFL